jgi:hypothetical protein
MDTYCLVTEPNYSVAYGGVLECELSARHLRLVLTSDTARDLDLPEEMSFALALSRDQLAMVSRGLDKVLRSGRLNATPYNLTLNPHT